VSHNDSDHLGGALRILAEYCGRVGQIYYLRDRPVSDNILHAVIRRQIADGYISREQVFRLECDASPKLVYSDTTNAIRLHILAPTYQDNLDAEDAQSPNDTSGILILDAPAGRIIFSGDAGQGEWESVNRRWGEMISCDVLTAPHHGGLMTNSGSDVQEGAFLNWFYKHCVQCKYAIISVGSNNSYRHPRSGHVEAIRNSGGVACCTQLTPQCNNDIESLRLGVLAPLFPSASRTAQDIGPRGHSRNVACGGTMVAEIGPSGISLLRIGAHQKAVDQMLKSPNGHPLCRPSPVP
jgi:beta-lactamase superfamily II metal-dependent hydrolase